MDVRPIALLTLLFASATAAAQEIVRVPQSKAQVARPDDLFSLPPGQWQFAKHLWEGPAPCMPTQCEAGITVGDLVISVEHSGEFVRIIAGLRGCEAVGYSEVEVGTKPGKPTFGRVRKQVERVVKGTAKTCNATAPTVPSLETAQLFPSS